MNDRQMFKALNGIDHKDEEVKEYIDLANISDKKISSITNDVKTKLAKEKFSEACIHVKEKILEKDEVIEKIVKATDPDMLAVATTANMMVGAPFMTGDGYSFNVLIFCTNKRIIIVNANYYNRMQGIKIYSNEEIKEINAGADVKKKYRFHFQLYYKRNKALAIGITLLALVAANALSKILAFVSYMLSSRSELVEKIVYYILIIPIAYFFLTRRKLQSEILIEFSNGKFKDLLIRNTDCDEIQEYLVSKYK